MAKQWGAAALLSHRMDFLLLLPHDVRIVIEVDGKHHYAKPDGMASPQRYADMARSDRELKLAGYEVYRFGVNELLADNAEAQMRDFFAAMFAAIAARSCSRDGEGFAFAMISRL